MMYSVLLMIGFIIVYTLFQMRQDHGILFWVFIICNVILVGTTGLCYLYLQPTDFVIRLSVPVEILFSFLILHVKSNRVSILFYMIFYVTIGLLTGIIMMHPSFEFPISLAITLVFFLSESNQKFMKKSYEESANEYQNKIVQKQVDEVQNIYLTMRGWRHDYHNHIQTIKAYITLNQIEQASEYLNNLDTDLDQIKPLVESGNVNLDAILNSKLSLALKQNINVTFKAKVPPSLLISDIDLCVLIGNLIDNAVEACEKVTSNDKFIRVYIGIFQKQLYISVFNCTNELVRKFDDEYISTKRGNHGHGLKRINVIVDKYQGYINRKNEPGVFVTEVMLPL